MIRIYLFIKKKSNFREIGKIIIIKKPNQTDFNILDI